MRVRLDVGQPTEVDVRAETWWADQRGPRHRPCRGKIPERRQRGGSSSPRGLAGSATARLCSRCRPLAFRVQASRQCGQLGELEVFRDLDHGACSRAANRRQGTLAVYLDDPPPASPDTRGHFAVGRDVRGRRVGRWPDYRGGGRHHPSEGTGRLTARRIDQAYNSWPTSDLDRLGCLC